jgi:opacity protein-like surface antigen
MRVREILVTLAMGALLGAAHEAAAQEDVPLDPNTKSAVTAAIGNDALQLGYGMHNDPVRNADLDLGFLIDEDRQILGTAALMFGADFVGIPGLTIKIGPKGYLGWLEGVGKTQIAAIGGGVSARYDVLPEQGVAVVLHAFFSPGILTFGVADNIYDFLAGGEFRATSRLTVVAGYRWLKITLDRQPDDELLNEVYAGVRWRLN